MRATVCWGSIRNRDCILYPGAGTVVLIRPAQTFYERIKFAFGQGYAVEDHTERAVMSLGRQRHKPKHHPAVHYSQVGEVLEYVRGAGTYPTKRLALGS